MRQNRTRLPGGAPTVLEASRVSVRCCEVLLTTGMERHREHSQRHEFFLRMQSWRPRNGRPSHALPRQGQYTLRKLHIDCASNARATAPRWPGDGGHVRSSSSRHTNTTVPLGVLKRTDIPSKAWECNSGHLPQFSPSTLRKPGIVHRNALDTCMAFVLT